MARYIDVNEAAEITGLKPATIRKYAREERIPHYRYGADQARYRFDKEEIYEWIQDHKVEVNRNSPKSKNKESDYFKNASSFDINTIRNT
tara:strand:+ start:7740 stop:8009 length:270 start_codon:yes stop_codon:yes gene_type:complete